MTGERIKFLLDELGVTQKALSEMLGVTPQSVSAIIAASDVRSGTLEKIANVLGVPMSRFYPNDAATITNESSELHVRNNSGVVSGTNNGSISTGQDAQRLVEMLVESNAKKDQQIDKLIALLSKQQ
nr:MAG TPA: hypothetical protein [Caudoviricetes sp.]